MKSKGSGSPSPGRGKGGRGERGSGGEGSPIDPESLTAFWLSVGLLPQSARALAAAGFHALADLEGVTRAGLRTVPGLRAGAVAVVEELLGLPYYSGRVPTDEELWRRRGLPGQAAVTFAQVGMTLGRLKSITREELLDMPSVGPKALRACEILLGRPVPSHRPFDHVAAFWRQQGLPAKAARALSKQGIASLHDLRPLSREDLEALPGIGRVVVRQLEKLLGHKIPSRASHWLDKGLSLYIANALVRANVRSMADLQALSRKQFLALPGLGLYALKQCEKKLGLRLPTGS